MANLGYVYHQQEQLHEAIEVYEKALVLSPREGPIFQRLGWSYMALGDHPKAREAYERAMALGIASARDFRDLGSINEQEGNLETARIYYQRAIELDREYGDSYYRLAALSRSSVGRLTRRHSTKKPLLWIPTTLQRTTIWRGSTSGKVARKDNV